MSRSLVALLLFLLLSVSGKSQSSTENQINGLMDQWHQAASEANADGFFGLMSDRCIYIGTDAWERWNKEEFIAFAKPYFDKGKAWDFKPFDRQVFISEDGKTVWFSELLNTWMGICRGSGILSLKDGNWKIEQYHLSVTLPNDEIQNFLKLVEGKQNTKKPD